MTTSIFTMRNMDRGTPEERAAHQEVMKKLSEKNAKRVIITYPDGSETEFDSGMKASRVLGGSPNLVANWIKNNVTPRGKFKGFSARWKD